MADPIRLEPQDEAARGSADSASHHAEVPPQSQENREVWPEEIAEPSARDKARSYFQKHPAAPWVLLALLLALLVGGYSIWHYYSIRESTDDAQIEGHIDPISPRVSGTVQQVFVDDNQVVQAGTVLVQLDPRDYQVALDRARADLADAQASAQAARVGVPITTTSTASGVSTAQANLAASQQEVDAAQARLREAQANWTKLNLDLKRMEALVTKDEVSQQQYDAAVAAEQASRATVDSARAGVATAQSHVAQAEAGLRSAQTAPQQVQAMKARAAAADATAQKDQAAVEQAQLNLQYATVRAPVTGVVSRKTVEPGQVVQPGQPLMALVNLEDIWVVANFKENQLRNMRVGQAVKIHVDTYNRDYNGHVQSVAGATGARFSLLPPENATGNYVKVVQRIPVKIVLDKGEDPQHNLRPGMSVEPTVMTGK